MSASTNGSLLPNGVDTSLIKKKFQDLYTSRYRDTLESFDPDENPNPTLHTEFEVIESHDGELADMITERPKALFDIGESALNDLSFLPSGLEIAHLAIDGDFPQVQLREIRAADVERLLSINGRVKNATETHPMTVVATFMCEVCGNRHKLAQERGNWYEPGDCQCGENKWTVVFRESVKTDMQRIDLQEPPDQLSGGETPETLRGYIMGEQAGTVTPGDRVRVNSIVEAKRQKDSPAFDKELDVKSVSVEDEEFGDINITEDEIQEIEQIANNEPSKLYEIFVQSFAPNIYGYERQKLALIFALFGGVRKELAGGNRRGDIHVLTVGDPGTGKSQLIEYANTIAPLGNYTNGKGATGVGLTAAAVKEESLSGNTDSWTLKAGTLVLSDGGVAAVDELDKMTSEDRSSMLEALERQKVSIAKAGINSTLQARCSLVAAANPEKGRFKPYEPLPTQVNLDPPLLSRFDLMFTIEDTPDEEKDKKLAKHILDVNDTELDSDQTEPVIEPDLFMKYISYARQNCHPTLSDKAKRRLKEEYVDLRSSGDGDVRPLSARELEALTRLSEASARLRLSDVVTKADAEKAIGLMKASLNDTQTDEDGNFDAAVVQTGTSVSQADRIEAIEECVETIDNDSDGAGAPRDEVIDLLVDQDFERGRVEETIEKLETKGNLYAPPGDGDVLAVVK